jgi:solute carrier family 25 (adenine nucleotide translocator) protein 4/5/6/31
MASVNLQQFAVGILPSIISTTLTNPLERLRIILQTQDVDPKYEKAEKFQVSTGVNTIVQKQGLWGLWRGNGVSCLRLLAGPMISDLTLSLVWSTMPQFDPKTEMDAYIATTAFTGLLHTPLFVLGMLPLDYLHTRISADTAVKPEFDGVWDCLRKTAQGPDGYRAFFKGFWSSFLSIFPYRLVAVFCYDVLSSLNPWAEEKTLAGILSGDFIGQVAVLLGMLASYPFITVKSRLQMEATLPLEQRLYKGEWDCFKQIVKQEGWLGLFRGAQVNMAKGIISGLILGLFNVFQ